MQTNRFSLELPRDAGSAESSGISRRSFVGGAAGISLASLVGEAMVGATVLFAGCGGGGDGGTQDGPAPALANQPPVWQPVPDITFTQGVAASVAIASFVSDADDDMLVITLNNVPLPEGVTYDAAGRRFVYDGHGAIGSTTGHVLTADDGAG